MELRLDGKTALVTGSSRGIGLGIARRFAEAGANVMLTSRKADSLAAVAADLDGLDGDVAWFAAHAADPEQIAACVAATMDRFGAVDVLVNNAATNPYYGPMIDIDRTRAEKTVALNQLGVLQWCQEVHRASMADRGGTIVNMSSIGGLGPEPGIGWYNATKAAVVHLTRQLAYELAPKVRVNALAPGVIKTDLARALWEGQEEALSRHTPLGRIGEPDDIAAAATFLASDAASWITGQVLVVDGGVTIVPHGGWA